MGATGKTPTRRGNGSSTLPASTKPLLTPQLWGPDTCQCLIHRGLEEFVYDWLPDPDGGLKQVERPRLAYPGLVYAWRKTEDGGWHPVGENPPDAGPKGHERPQLTIYLTHAQAVDLHVARFIRNPGGIVRWRRFYLFKYLPTWMRWPDLVRLMAMALQPHSRRCRVHQHLGETQELYDTIVEEVQRKSYAGEMAWRLANEVTDEDLLWLSLAPDPEEHAARTAVLERTAPRRKIRWDMGPDRQVIITFPPLGMLTSHMEELPPGGLRAIQLACDARFGQGRVEITQMAGSAALPARLRKMRAPARPGWRDRIGV